MLGKDSDLFVKAFQHNNLIFHICTMQVIKQELHIRKGGVVMDLCHGLVDKPYQFDYGQLNK